ncbi:MAG: ribonuclease P protein component [Bacteroidales bacterium]|nr:ribonuclease P protein component [Bacteroidales bacterium]
MPNYTFTKQERLCSRSLIESLFHSGHRLMVFPYSVSWMLVSQDKNMTVPAQVLITTSKKKFHHAVDRNRVKRLTRECYRLRKHGLYDFLEEHHLQIVFSLNYIHTEIMDFSTLSAKFDKLLPQLESAIQKTVNETK